jgi:hypothetical protein
VGDLAGMSLLLKLAGWTGDNPVGLVENLCNLRTEHGPGPEYSACQTIYVNRFSSWPSLWLDFATIKEGSPEGGDSLISRKKRKATYVTNKFLMFVLATGQASST